MFLTSAKPLGCRLVHETISFNVLGFVGQEAVLNLEGGLSRCIELYSSTFCTGDNIFPPQIQEH